MERGCYICVHNRKRTAREKECKKGHRAKNVPVDQAAKMLGKSRQFVRVALQRGIAPFGFAVKLSGERFSYHISPKKLNEYIGI